MAISGGAAPDSPGLVVGVVTLSVAGITAMVGTSRLRRAAPPVPQQVLVTCGEIPEG